MPPDEIGDWEIDWDILVKDEKIEREMLLSDFSTTDRCKVSGAVAH